MATITELQNRAGKAQHELKCVCLELDAQLRQALPTDLADSMNKAREALTESIREGDWAELALKTAKYQSEFLCPDCGGQRTMRTNKKLICMNCGSQKEY